MKNGQMAGNLNIRCFMCSDDILRLQRKHLLSPIVQGDFETYAIIVTTASRTEVKWKYRENRLSIEWGKTPTNHPQWYATDPPFKQLAKNRSNKNDVNTFSFHQKCKTDFLLTITRSFLYSFIVKGQCERLLVVEINSGLEKDRLLVMLHGDRIFIPRFHIVY